MVFEISDSTKVKIAADLLVYYYKNKDNKDYHGEKVEEALKKIEAAEREYFAILECLYMNNQSIDRTAWDVPCGKNTVLRKRDKMLIMLFNEVLAGIIFPAISFYFKFITICRPLSKVCRPEP